MRKTMSLAKLSKFVTNSPCILTSGVNDEVSTIFKGSFKLLRVASYADYSLGAEGLSHLSYVTADASCDTDDDYIVPLL